MANIRDTRIEGARSQHVVIEFDLPDWTVMYHDGSVETFGTAEKALRSVQKESKRGNKTITVTTIEWRNVPEGWTPPRIEPRERKSTMTVTR